MRHSGRNFDHQTRIKRLGNQVLRAKGQTLARIGRRDHLALFRLCQFGNGVHRSDFHLDRDGGCASIQGAAKNIGEAQNVVHLVGVVGAPSGHDGIVTNLFDLFRENFRRRIGQRQDQWLGRHFLDHLGFEHATGGQAQEHIGALDHF